MDDFQGNGPTDARKAWREHLARAGRPAPTIRIGVAASFTADPLVPFVGTALLANGITPEFKVGPYNQLFQTCLDPEAGFGGPVEVAVLMWRLEDLVRDEITAFLNGDDAALGQASDAVASLAGMIGQLRAGFSGMVIAGLPPYPTGVGEGLLSLDNPHRLGSLHRRLSGEFVDALGRADGVSLIDLDAVQRQVGLAASFDPRKWYLYRQPFSEVFLHAAGNQLARLVTASRRAPKKCVVLDADNTLWGGIVGEDGIDGIEIGGEFPGSAYRDFQNLLLGWRSRGVLLALASKNNEADVWEVVDNHGGMVLKREHLSTWQINWLPKTENLPRIAKALNIGTDSLVFIDDNPMEIAQMRAALPEVTSILLPEDPADILRAMHKLTLFDQLDVSDEDRKRADMMRAERGREDLGARIGHADFLKALDLEIDLFRARKEDLGRVTQLINKTNQFNLTTIRRTLDEVRALAHSDRWRVYGLRVADKFGDYGLTGVVIAEVSPDGRCWTLDSLLMSCRVLGRGVEAALIGGLAADARAEGVTEFRGSFIATAKNGVAASFLADQGFSPAGREWRLGLAGAPAIPAHVRRIGVSVEPSMAELAG